MDCVIHLFHKNCSCKSMEILYFIFTINTGECSNLGKNVFAVKNRFFHLNNHTVVTFITAKNNEWN